MDETGSTAQQERRREVLRQAGVALDVSLVILWEAKDETAIVPVLTSMLNPPYHESILDVDATLRRWGIPIVPGSRWVRCRLPGSGRWCVAPVRLLPAAPPPGGVERRSRERVTLELAGLCLGLIDLPFT